jgi:hypothetical protein
MPRAFPSQITAYLAASFETPGDLNQALIHSYPGAAMGFLELYDQLPNELIRLSADHHAELIKAIATIRYGLDKFRHPNSPDALVPVAPALKIAWPIIAALQDQVPATTHDFSFIGDAVLQEMVGLDMAAISTALQSGEWKGATIIADSCCEALLLYGLQVIETKASGTLKTAVAAIRWPSKRAPNDSDLTDRSWDLFSYAEVAGHVQIISSSVKSELDLARNYRNLIHPAKTVREQFKCDRGTAFIGVGALEHLISDLKRNL